jgi:hypothetical protein
MDKRQKSNFIYNYCKVKGEKQIYIYLLRIQGFPSGGTSERSSFLSVENIFDFVDYGSPGISDGWL